MRARIVGVKCFAKKDAPGTPGALLIEVLAEGTELELDELGATLVSHGSLHVPVKIVKEDTNG